MTDDFDPRKVAWVMDAAAFERFCTILGRARQVYWDLETTGLNEWGEPDGTVPPKIVMGAFTLENGDTWVLPLYHPDSPWYGKWRSMIRRVFGLMVGKALEAHNGKFDCRWGHRHTGVDLSGSMEWDTRLSAHLLDENFTTKLKPRAEQTFDIERWDDFSLEAEGAALTVPLFDLGIYAARDTYWGWRLSENHKDRMFVDSDEQPLDDEEIEEARLGRLMKWVAMPTVRTMTAVEQRGIALDLDWVKDTIEENEALRAEHWDVLVGRYPDLESTKASFATTSLWFIAWAEAAVKAGDLEVAALTKGGKAQWSRQVLTRQARNGSEVAERLLLMRGAIKRLEYLRSWLEYVREDGRIHAGYNVGALITGRLSSSGPNLQQVTKKLRPAFISAPGYYLVDFDYSQIELRIAAFIARCQPMIDAFIRGDDLHNLIAARITGKDPMLVTPDERQGGKAGNFGFLFGQSAYGFRFYAENTYGLSFTEQECNAIYKAFFDEWEGMMSWHHRTIATAHRTGQVVSPLGRVRRLPGIHSGHDGTVKHAENAALNAPVQGFASDVMQMAAGLVEGTIAGSDRLDGVNLVATVHDSIVAEIRIDDWEALTREVIRRMTDGVLPLLRRMDVDFDVPLVAEATIGTRWGLKDIGEIA